jgi:light-regulated signal transduction histidine kinase (bacteriophytochrome)
MMLRTADSKLDKDEKDNLQAIIANARQMGQLIDNLLDFSRLGKTAIAKNPVNMTQVVANVVNEIKSSVPDSNAEINIQKMQQAECDPVLIKQVWVNLVSNAFKYSRKKEKPVIEIGSQGQNGSQVFYIKDNGAGFDMEHSQKLFGVFQRLHKVAEYEGTGVGLALVHRIITKHGGKIWADAKMNEGATFYFTLS